MTDQVGENVNNWPGHMRAKLRGQQEIAPNVWTELAVDEDGYVFQLTTDVQGIILEVKPMDALCGCRRCFDHL